MPEKKRLYRVDDMSRLTGLTPSSIRKKAILPRWKKEWGAKQPGGTKGDWFFDADKVDEWLKNLEEK